MRTRIFGLVGSLFMLLAVWTYAQDVDLTRLPIGTENVGSSPAIGGVWVCNTTFNGRGAQGIGPWIDTAAGTYDFTAKYLVDGEVMWDHVFDVALNGATRNLEGNALPPHPTGIYPIASTDDAYQIDRNPHTITAQELMMALPSNPTVAAEPSCVSMGTIGVMLTGVVFFNATDAEGRDAVAYEIQDACDGHPESSGEYHYHNLSACVAELQGDTGDGHSPLMGYVLDGFGIYGHYGEDGAVITNADLDECHGHTHMIEWDGQMVEMYHYHATYEFPYTVGCYRGTPIEVAMGAGQGQQQQSGGQNPPQGGGNPPPTRQGGGNPPPPRNG